jgi:hypothetical protein
MDAGSGCSLASISAKFNESKTRSDRSVVACSGTYNNTSMSLSYMGFREGSKTVVWSAVIEEAEWISEL